MGLAIGSQNLTSMDSVFLAAPQQSEAGIRARRSRPIKNEIVDELLMEASKAALRPPSESEPLLSSASTRISATCDYRSS